VLALTWCGVRPVQVCDIAAITSIAHAAGALVCVDNSFLTPLYQRPLQLGADISMTSGTKYIGGHGDTTLGMLAVRDPELGKQLYFLQNSEGAGLAPMDCWLALRGLKTVSASPARSCLQLLQAVIRTACRTTRCVLVRRADIQWLLLTAEATLEQGSVFPHSITHLAPACLTCADGSPDGAQCCKRCCYG
jgi:hypothetical protein